MKLLMIALMSILTLTTYAGTLDVHCGEIVKARKATKNPILRLLAVKVKLRDSKHYYGVAASSEGKFKGKFGFTDDENHAKVLGKMKAALAEKEARGVPVYVCIGEVKGLDRWHKVGSYSLTSTDDAFKELYEKYGTSSEIRIKW